MHIPAYTDADQHFIYKWSSNKRQTDFDKHFMSSAYKNANVTLFFCISFHHQMTVLLSASHHFQRNYESQGFGWIIYHSGLFVLQVSTNLRLLKTKKENQSRRMTCKVNEFKHKESTEHNTKNNNGWWQALAVGLMFFLTSHVALMPLYPEFQLLAGCVPINSDHEHSLHYCFFNQKHVKVTLTWTAEITFETF